MFTTPIRIFPDKLRCIAYAFITILFFIFLCYVYNSGFLLILACVFSLIPIVGNLRCALRKEPALTLTNQGIEFDDIGLVLWDDIEYAQITAIVTRNKSYWIQINLKPHVKYKVDTFRNSLGHSFNVTYLARENEIHIWPYLSVDNKWLVDTIKKHIKWEQR